MSLFDIECGQSVRGQCDGQSVANESGFTDVSFKKFVGGFVNVFTSPLTIFLSISTQIFSLNLIRSVNALRCAFVSAADNSWNFIAAAWWASAQYSMENYIEEGLDLVWPYICTCNFEMDFLSQKYGASDESVIVFESCSEDTYILTISERGMLNLSSEFLC